MDNSIMENEMIEAKLKSFELVSMILGAKEIHNDFVKRFETLKDVDFKQFCDSVTKDSFITNNQIEDVNSLNKVFSEMQLISSFPELHSKTVGAIGGGFSAGKSCFINSFMKNDDIKLAEGIRPVTAIPSYVVCGDDSKIQGISNTGAVFEMDADVYKSISHEMMKNLQFDLKKILKYITVKIQMDEEYFKNMCLIDT